MRESSRRRVSPALVISIVALVLAAGGNSFASAPVAFVAKTFGLNGKQKRQVKAIADSEIGHKSPTLSVLFAKSAGSATTAASATTATTAASAASATTASTALAANALNGVQIVKGPTVTNEAKIQNFSEVSCPAGLHAIGGGVLDSGLKTEQAINQMGIANVGKGNVNNGFAANVINTGVTNLTFHVWVLCANAEVTGES